MRLALCCAKSRFMGAGLEFPCSLASMSQTRWGWLLSALVPVFDICARLFFAVRRVRLPGMPFMVPTLGHQL